jgi:adenosylmethionine-8-amino-7-oxononanoate aminotransferase
MALPAPQNEQARAAVDEYKTRVRLGSAAERAELIARLKDVLDDEELENYDAALQRRPVVASASGVAMQLNQVINEMREVRERSGGIAVPAVLVERVQLEGVLSR